METVLLAAWAAAAVLLVLLAIAEMTKHRRLEREKRRQLYGRWWQRRGRDRSARTSRFDSRAEAVSVTEVPRPVRPAAVRAGARRAATAPRNSGDQSGAGSTAQASNPVRPGAVREAVRGGASAASRSSADGSGAASVAQVPNPVRPATVREAVRGDAPAASGNSSDQAGAGSIALPIEATHGPPRPVPRGDTPAAQPPFSEDDPARRRTDNVTPGASSDQPLLVGVGLAASVVAGWFLVWKRR